jgi:hypothetical protein
MEPDQFSGVIVSSAERVVVRRKQSLNSISMLGRLTVKSPVVAIHQKENKHDDRCKPAKSCQILLNGEA